MLGSTLHFPHILEPGQVITGWVRHNLFYRNSNSDNEFELTESLKIYYIINYREIFSKFYFFYYKVTKVMMF